MSKQLRVLWVAIAVFGPAVAGCSRTANVDAIPLGTEVQLTRQDGGVVDGRLSARDVENVRVVQGSVDRTVARREIVDARIVDDRTPTPLLSSARFRDVRVPERTALEVQLDSTLASNASQVDDPVEATLTAPVQVNSTVVIPAGSVLEGRVIAAKPSGKVQGRASLAVSFSTLKTRGESYPIVARVEQVARGTKGEDAEKIGLPAAGGAIIGALVGGKKGAAVGGAVGAGAGTAVVLTTAGDEVRWPRGATLTVPLDQPVDVRVPIKR